MKGIQVLMLIALFAISTCTKGYFTEKFNEIFKKKNKESIDVMGLLDEIVLTDEDKRQITFAQEYLKHFDDDTENITNNPRIQIIVDSKKASKQVVEDLLRKMEQLKNDYDSKLAEAKRLNSIFNDEETFERVQLSINEEYAKNAQSAVERAERKSNQVFLEAYNRMFNN